MIKKRFHIINGAENLVKYGIYCKPVLVDEETGNQYVLALELMDILNELYEENKELKKENEELKHNIAIIDRLIDNKIDEFKNGDYGDLPCNTIHMFLDLKQEIGDKND